MGAIALRYGLTDEAVRYGQLAVSLDPNHLDGWKLLGLAYYTKGEFVSAADAYEKAAAIKPGDGEIQRNLGLALAEIGEAGRAEEALKKAFAADGNAETAFFLGKLYYGAGRYEEALEYALQSIRKDGKSPKAYNLKGVVLNQLGRHAEAAGSFQAGLVLAPEDIGLQVNLGIAYINSQRAGQGQARPRSGPAQDHGRGPEEADRGVPRVHQGRSEVGREKRASRARRKDTPFSTKARPSGQRSWKMPRSKAKSPSPVL